MTEVVSERRRERRRRSLLGGTVVLPNGLSTMQCVVRDLTDHGARLRFGGPALVSSEFELRIDGRNHKYAARKIWVHDGEMGVEFI